ILPQVGAPLPEDEYYDDILKAIKSVNHHLGDKDFNETSIDNAWKHKDKLSKLFKHEDAEIRRMAEDYIAKIEEMHSSFVDAVNGKGPGKKVSKFVQYLRKSEPKAAQAVKPKGMVVRKGKVLMQKRTNTAGEIITDGTEHDLTSIFHRSMTGGTQFEIEFEDGVTAIYRPWAGNKNIFATAGEMEIRVDGACTPEIVEKALEKIERLGLNASPASIEDAEFMYLQKQAYIQGIDKSPRFKKAMTTAEGLKTKQGQVKILRQFWNAELGVDDVTKLPHYDPFGSFQHATRGKIEGAGRRVQMRFDISEAELDRDLAGHSLKHRLTNDGDMADFINQALDNNGAMVSTIEKMRLGITPGGMSPTSDMESGGASYFFTRIRKTPTAARTGEPGLYFKRKLLRRMDSITYDHDKFGRCTGDEVRKNRKAFLKDWKRIVDRDTSDETIFKYTVTLLDNLESIVAKSSSERSAVLAAFKKRGITRLPDGRKIEDIVFVRR
ncbi:MAG: hypothetical protein P9L99_06940, partial [Candidatus Lernaella stagnicola]|nr:hypothetical protein [Candidatus Lernaella stagnicola]